MDKKRILEVETHPGEERLILQVFQVGNEEFISVFSERYQDYGWKESGWYSSPDEGSLIPVAQLDDVIEALQKFRKTLPLR